MRRQLQFAVFRDDIGIVLPDHRAAPAEFQFRGFQLVRQEQKALHIKHALGQIAALQIQHGQVRLCAVLYEQVQRAALFDQKLHVVSAFLVGALLNQGAPVADGNVQRAAVFHGHRVCNKPYALGIRRQIDGKGAFVLNEHLIGPDGYRFVRIGYLCADRRPGAPRNRQIAAHHGNPISRGMGCIPAAQHFQRALSGQEQVCFSRQEIPARRLYPVGKQDCRPRTVLRRRCNLIFPLQFNGEGVVYIVACKNIFEVPYHIDRNAHIAVTAATQVGVVQVEGGVIPVNAEIVARKGIILTALQIDNAVLRGFPERSPDPVLLGITITARVIQAAVQHTRVLNLGMHRVKLVPIRDDSGTVGVELPLQIMIDAGIVDIMPSHPLFIISGWDVHPIFVFRLMRRFRRQSLGRKQTQ